MTIVEMLLTYIPLTLTVAGAAAFLWGAHWMLLGRNPDLSVDKQFSRQLSMLALTVLSILAVVVALPVTESTRNQMIGLLGLVISGVFAFSSSTIFANLLAGLMLRVTRPFRAGDFIRVDAHFGRVAETGLLDTEIQTETRELIAVPNMFLITNPVSVVRTSGTIVSATMSLGYDVHHRTIETCLLDAAKDSGLEEPFVHLLELGNYAVTYRISGLLKDVKSLITARSNLYRAVLDALHGQGIEIMSPSFMNQRRLDDGQRMIPPSKKPQIPEGKTVAEEIIFDKAEMAAQREEKKLQLQNEIQTLTQSLKEASEVDRSRIETAIAETRAALEAIIKMSAPPAADKISSETGNDQ